MPYIKKELRPVFDSAVILAQKERIGDASSQILFGVENMEPKVLDGCLNYVFTQMLRKVEDLVDVRLIMDLVINTLFWSQPKYIRFERVKGLFGCMIDEYRRRKWRRQREVVKILKCLLEMHKHRTAEYEDGCIRKNGDLK